MSKNFISIENIPQEIELGKEKLVYKHSRINYDTQSSECVKYIVLFHYYYQKDKPEYEHIKKEFFSTIK